MEPTRVGYLLGRKDSEVFVQGLGVSGFVKGLGFRL